MQTIKIPVVSPAGLDDKTEWQRDFVQKATRLDAEGHPLEGTFGLDCGVRVDLRTASVADVQNSYVERQTEKGHPCGPRSMRAHLDQQLFAARRLFTPNALFAFKKGTTIVAWAIITSPYSYDATEPDKPHRWGYRILRHATEEEGAVKHTGVLRPAFVEEGINRPDDLIALRRELFQAELRAARAAEAAAELALQRAREAVMAAAHKVASLY